MSRNPGIRAAVIAALGILAGVLANLATSGFDLGKWRWWLMAGLVISGMLIAGFEYRRTQKEVGKEPNSEGALTSQPQTAKQGVVEQLLGRYELDEGKIRAGEHRKEKLKGVRIRQEIVTDVDGGVREITELSIEEITLIPIRIQEEKDAD